VKVVIDHPRASDLNVILTSPSGTASQMMKSVYIAGSTTSNSMSGIAMVSWRCLGEAPDGDWTLKIADGQNGYASTWTSWTLTLEGEGSASTLLVAASEPPAARPPAPAPAASGAVAWWNGSRWSEAVEDPALLAEWTPRSAQPSWLSRQTDVVAGPAAAERGFTVWRLREGATRSSVLSRAPAGPAPVTGRVFRDGPLGDGRLRALTGRVLVRFAPGLLAADVARLEALHGLTLVRRQHGPGDVRVYRLDPPGPSPLDVAKSLLSEGGVLHAEPDWWTGRTTD
jgi:hypothetical protein